MRQLSILRRGSPGQAMVLGAVALLCLTLGVLATLNLGQAVHEKIKLQNNADAAAYSLATMEARTFNYIAFTNRLQISHYHTAMVVQSYLSYAGFCLSYFGSAADVIRAMAYGLDAGCRTCPSWPPPYPAIKAMYCALSPVFQGFSRIMDTMAGIAQTFYDLPWPLGHDGAKTFVEAMSLFNRDAVWRRLQVLKAAQLNVHILTGMEDFIKKNDTQLGWTASGNTLPMAINTILNSFEYWSAFDKSAGLNPSAVGLFTEALSGGGNVRAYKIDANKDEVKEAEAIMAELTNATRSHKNVYDRRENMIPLVVVTGQKFGQTRLIGGGDGIEPQPKIAAIGNQKHYRAGGNMGDRLASDDYLQGGMGFITVVIETVTMDGRKIGDGILTAAKDSKHWKYTFKKDEFNGVKRPLVIPSLWPAAIPETIGKTYRGPNADMEDKKHPWTGTPYLAPYVKFNPGDASSDGPTLKTHEYNQPNTWIYLNKRPENLKVGKNDDEPPWKMKFTMTGPNRGNFVRTHDGTNNDLRYQAKQGGGNTVSLDTTIGGERQAFLDFMQGLNVLSRGQVYYHRPGDWREQPNFFNPFWRARLAPIAGILGNLWERLVGNQLVPGPEAGLIQQMMQNFLNNALADFLMSIVSSIITH